LAQMPIFRIESIDDPRVAPFCDLKKSTRCGSQDYFIAEGRFVLERLIESDFQLHAVLMSDKRYAEFKDRIPPTADVYLVRHELCRSIVGFKFHSGILGCGLRSFRQSVSGQALALKRVILLCLPHTSNPDNLGSIIRNSAALGAGGLIVGPNSADPFSRRAIRVSMGNGFRLPIFQPFDLPAELERLRNELGFRIVGACLDRGSIGAGAYPWGAKSILLLGNEGFGLDRQWVELCEDKIKVEMAGGVDSLNVATSAAIFLYEYRRSSDDWI
jgi:tRNA G18 (ribose-2'-O)-methylase SpoU